MTRAKIRRPSSCNGELRRAFNIADEIQKMLRKQNRPETPDSLYFLLRLEKEINGARAYWRDVLAAMEEAKVELKVIEKGQRNDA
jgi:hypothetical protein